MALMIQSSNRVETLQQNLSIRLASGPLRQVFEPEIIVVPTFAMSRWLNLRIAEQQRIAANILYPLPANWLWDVAARLIDDLPAQDPLAQKAMVWKIFAILSEQLDHKAFESVRSYLNDDDHGIKCWQLATRLAHIYERYQQYRPELIRDWSTRQGSDWQAIIWQHLIAGLNGNHRVEILNQLVARLNRDEPATSLPERVSLFAISNLPPLTIEVIHALAKHTDITLYQHSPTDQYWADLKSNKQLTRLRLSEPEHASYYDSGNELLVSWGRQSQAMQDLLLNYGSVVSRDAEFNQPPGNSTLLTSIQQSIFDLSASPKNLKADDSLCIHICHSPLRECQVLHDHLLRLLNDNRDLNYEDILVMVPEISRYAPYIEAVFAHDEKAARPFLAWNLSDISIADDHPLIQSFQQLLSLPNSRFSFSEVMSLLEVDEIRIRYEIDAQALDDMQNLLSDSRIRWGIDVAHKQSQGLPEINENTWQQARDRLFAGYAMADVELWHDIAPLALSDTNMAIQMGRFWRLFETLSFWRNELGKPASASEWQQRLNRMIDAFYLEIDFRENRLQQIRDVINDLNLADKQHLSPALVRDWLQQQLSEQTHQGRLFSGGITFCGMRPMRNLPFPVICLLGMNDADFPRRESVSDMDLITQHRQPGDPHKGEEDRYLMLETLLCSRRQLYISYCGRSLKDNSVQQPSVLVQEMLDFLDASPTDENTKLSERISTVHPMQSFALQNYDMPTPSFDRYWCEVAKSLQKPDAVTGQHRWPLELDSHTRETINDFDLAQIHRFLAHPVKYFFNRQLKIFLTQDDSDDDEEIFSIQGLDSWQIKTRLADDLLKGETNELNLLRAEGRLPHGIAATVELDNIRLDQQQWLAQLSNYKEAICSTRQVHCVIADNKLLYGEVNHCYSGIGLMHYTASRFKGRHLLAMWLDHLALCASEQILVNEVSRLFTIDRQFELKPIEPGQAKQQLLDYCLMFQQGQHGILPVFPLSSFACANGDNTDSAWFGNPQFGHYGDIADEYIQLATRHVTELPISDSIFTDYANRLYAAVLDQVSRRG